MSEKGGAVIMGTKNARDVFLYIPNLIGYARVILSCISFFYYENPLLFSSLYVTSFLLDAADGHFARMFNQCSRFGAVLDMITDRFSTAILCVILGHLWPQYSKPLMLMIVLDICSHWLSMYSGVLQGKSHKANHKNILMRLYYEERMVLGGVCLFNEFFYVALYLLHFFPYGSGIIGQYSYWTLLISSPVYLFKQVVNVLQLITSSQDIVNWELINENK